MIIIGCAIGGSVGAVLFWGLGLVGVPQTTIGNRAMYAGYKEDGDTCGVDGCRGVLVFANVDNCSCHISAPCSQCTDSPLCCPECGWTDEREPETRIVRAGGGVSSIEHKPKALDRTRIDYRSKSHTASTMIKEGVYPDGTSRGEVEAVVRGSFGGRFEQFGGGNFRYIAYTD